MTLATKVEITVLDVGQGMGNLIRVFNGNTVIAVILVDLGNKGNAPDKQALINNLVTKIEANSSTPKLTALVVSHKDRDHWNLLLRLSQELRKKGVSANQLYIGGLGWEAWRRKEIIEIAQNLSAPPITASDPWPSEIPQNLQVLPDSFSNYRVPWISTLRNLADNVRVRVLCSNIATGNGNQVTPNSTSAVVVIEILSNGARTATAILPGDATGATLNYIREQIFSMATPRQLQPCMFLSVPHHGASASLADNGMGEVSAEWLGTELNPRILAASAGANDGYKHPYKRVMGFFGPSPQPVVEHNVLWYENLSEGKKRKKPSAGWIGDSVKVGYYTTLIQQTRLGADCVFEINAATGTITPKSWPGQTAANVGAQPNQYVAVASKTKVAGR